jgi:hypothetical protein
MRGETSNSGAALLLHASEKEKGGGQRRHSAKSAEINAPPTPIHCAKARKPPPLHARGGIELKHEGFAEIKILTS